METAISIEHLRRVHEEFGQLLTATRQLRSAVREWPVIAAGLEGNENSLRMIWRWWVRAVEERGVTVDMLEAADDGDLPF